MASPNIQFDTNFIRQQLADINIGDKQDLSSSSLTKSESLVRQF